ncbi:MAG: metal ABC transporter substrate-binding protein [Lachnospiraceae bacterium]|nr:metal ABC transporter substrate-binding protein [Lachnospiraceae bacterium]
MKNKYTIISIMLIFIALVAYSLTTAYMTKNKATEKDNLTVVTSFYPVYIAALNVMDGAEGVTLENLSEPQTGCIHDYQLTPADMKLLETADVFLINGGGIEGFLSDVTEGAYSMEVVAVTDGIEFLEEEDETNAHVWMDIDNYLKEVENIRDIMSDIDKDNAALYEKNASEYIESLEELKTERDELKTQIESKGGVSAALLQESFEYFADMLGIEVVYTMDLDEERQISAGEVADTMSAVNDGNASMVLTDELYGAELAETVSGETGVAVCTINPCVRGEYEKNSYIEAMRQNLENVATLLK